MSNITIQKYLNSPTDIYHLIDQGFIDNFGDKQKLFMFRYYNDRYIEYCKENDIKPLPSDVFLRNARRRKVKLIQICCPYCGYTDLLISDLKISEIMNMKYCTRCGRRSTAEYLFLQLSAFIRLREVHKLGIEALCNKYKPEEIQILSYDVYHMELVELASILEKILRDFFIDMSSLKYKIYDESYMVNVVYKSTNNDFMLLDKANDHYKKALGINIKQLISDECRMNLIDLAKIRNVIVHNNGIIDERFKKSPTYGRIGSTVKGDLIFVDTDMINRYLMSMFSLIEAVEKEFNNIFDNEMHTWIANYYFNL